MVSIVLFPSKRKKAIISLIKRPRTILRPEMDSLLLGKNHATCTACTRLTFCVGASSGSSGLERCTAGKAQHLLLGLLSYFVFSSQFPDFGFPVPGF